jgi:hypothetical protein
MQVNKRIIIFSFTIVIILIAVFIGWIMYYFFLPLNTKDWSIYNSNYYGYSVKYPNNWKTFGYGADFQDDLQPGGGSTDFQERYFKNPKNESEEVGLKVWISNPLRYTIFEKQIKTMPFVNKRTEEMVVGGTRVLKITGDPPPNAGIPVSQTNKCNKWIYFILNKLNQKYLCLSNRQATAFFSKGKYIYILHTEGVSFKIFDAILASFKFIE